MHKHWHIGKAEKTPTLGRPGPTNLSGLPDDLLRQGVKRLGLASLIYACTYFLAYFGPLVFYWLHHRAFPPHTFGPNTLVAVLAIAMALGMLVLTKRSSLPPSSLLDLGLAFEVVGALGISMTNMYGVFPTYSPELMSQVSYVGIPWECVWIIVYPILAPNTPRKSLMAALLAASMSPLVVAISKATGATSPDALWRFFAGYFLFTTYLCAFMAYFSSRIIMRFGASLLRARQLGQYEMLQTLGKGGMGEVWLARHRMLARPTAIKLIRPDALVGDAGSRRGLLRRFEREAKATAALQSVHTIGIYDFGITPDGAFYYVMELLDGLDMDTFVERFGPLPPARAVHWLRQACHSLHEAHERDMVHRDIKPANLFVCRLGPDHDFIKVLDFGLVKSDPNPGDDATKLTQEGIAFGTPGYMAPEMAMGSQDADARSDIYALGCLGYFLLTGEPVFAGDTPLATVLKHIQDEPAPPSSRSEMEIPAGLESLILQCLAKDPTERPESMQALDAALARCLDPDSWTAGMAATWWNLHMPSQGETPFPPGTPEGQSDVVHGK